MVDKYTQSIASAQTYRPEAVEYYGFHPDFSNYRPGQFYFLNIPEISINEWHPFTATAMLDDGGLLFFIKVMSNKANPRPKGKLRNVLSAWTARLAELAKSETLWLPVMRLHGPFGHNDYSQYENLLLFAGGIGITPLIAIFADLRARALTGDGSIGKLKNVVLIWMSRFVDEFRMFEEIFGMIVADRIKSKIYLNQSLPSAAHEGHDDDGLDEDGPETMVQRKKGKIEMDGDDEDDSLDCRAAMSSNASNDATVNVVHTDKTNMATKSSNIAAQVAGVSLGETNVDEAAIELGLANALKELKKAGIAREEAEANFNREMQTSDIGDCNFDIRLHCTRRESFISLTSLDSPDYVRMLINEGRCDLPAIFREYTKAGEKGKTMAAVCGPVSLTNDISVLAWNHDCDFHPEQFYF